MKLFIAALILVTSVSVWSKEVRVCSEGHGNFSGKTAFIFLDFMEVGELSLTVEDKGGVIGGYDKLIIGGKTYELANWEGQLVEATASYDKVNNVVTAEFVTPTQKISGTFTHCDLESK